MSDQASIDRVVGQLQGALVPLVREVESLGTRMDDMNRDTNRRHEENATMHARDKAEMRDFITSSVSGVKTGSDAAIAMLDARLVPLEFDLRMRAGRRQSKRALLAKAGIIAAIGAAIQSSWGAIKGGLIWLLNWHR